MDRKKIAVPRKARNRHPLILTGNHEVAGSGHVRRLSVAPQPWYRSFAPAPECTRGGNLHRQRGHLFFRRAAEQGGSNEIEVRG